MSKLQELIQRLCPDGVEYKKLGEVAEYIRGVTYSKSQECKFPNEKGIKILRANNITLFSNTLNFEDVKMIKPNTRIKDSQWLKADDILICAGSGSKEHVGKVAYIKTNIDYAFGGFMAVLRVKDRLMSKFLFFVLSSSYFADYLKMALNSTTINNLNGSIMNVFKVPVPPLEVQEEIVRILDRFDVYAAELQAELHARKEQYEYYRNLLLTFNPAGCAGEADDEQEGSVTTWGEHSYPIQWKTMGEVFEMSAGKAIPADRIKNQMSEESPIKCYGANGLRGYVNLSSHIGPNVIIGRQGALCGNITYATGKFYATDHAVVVCASEIFHPRFIFHMLTHANLNQYKTAGAQPGLSVSRLQSVSIPVPPLELQEKIVAVLDRFETLVNDLSEGLPAEIAAVKEQYEYYRNRLLTFKEKTA